MLLGAWFLRFRRKAEIFVSMEVDHVALHLRDLFLGVLGISPGSVESIIFVLLPVVVVVLRILQELGVSLSRQNF